MNARTHLLPIFAAASFSFVLPACEQPDDDDDATGDDDDATGDDDDADCALELECSSTWGPVPASGRVYVDSAAEAGGDGSCEAPFLTVDDGLALVRSSGARSLALAPGVWGGSWILNDEADGNNDNGLDISGCGRGETALEGIVDGGDVGLPVFEILGADTADLTLRDFAIEGGRRSIVIRGGSGSKGAITVERVDINEPVRVGIIVSGVSTVAHLLDVNITDPVVEAGIGWGASIQTGQQGGVPVSQATVIEGVDIVGATGVGLVGDGGWLLITSSTVSGTLPLGAGARNEGELGRGIQLQNRTTATLDNVTSEGNFDSAVFLHRPGRLSVPVDIVDSRLLSTAAADVPDSDETSGDGLTISQGGETQPATGFPVSLEDSTITGNPRAQVVAEGAELTLIGVNDIDQTGIYAIATQGGGLVIDPGAETIDDLTGDDVLGLNQDPIAPDDLDAGLD